LQVRRLLHYQDKDSIHALFARPFDGPLAYHATYGRLVLKVHPLLQVRWNLSVGFNAKILLQRSLQLRDVSASVGFRRFRKEARVVMDSRCPRA
jgi:hypothetical protein